MSSLTPALIGLFGVLLGALLRPYIEEAFKRRRDSLYLEFEQGTTSLLSDSNKDLQLRIGDQVVDRVFIRNFMIRNRTKRTLRDLKATFRFEYKQGVAERRQKITIYKSSDAEATLDVPNENPFVVTFARFDRGGKISGRVLSTYLGELKAFTDSDIEVFVGDRSKLSHPAQLLYAFTPMVAGLLILLFSWFMRFLRDG